MRFLLVIPVFVLFLSNMPFIQEMPMDRMMAIMKEQEKQEEEKCCKNAAAAEKSSCGMEAADPEPEPEPMACHPGNMPDDGSCQPTGTTCICICVFQFAAPEQDIRSFQFDTDDLLAGRTGYLQLKWKDPHIASPGQPPDHL